MKSPSINRRHFFGMLAAAVTAILAPKAIAAPVRVGLPAPILRVGDQLSISGVDTLMFYSMDLCDQTGRITHVTGPLQVGGGPVFIAPHEYTVIGLRTVSSRGYVGDRAIITIERGRR